MVSPQDSKPTSNVGTAARASRTKRHGGNPAVGYPRSRFPAASGAAGALVRSWKSPLVTTAMLILTSSCGPSRGTIGAVLARQPSGEVTVRQVPEGLGSDDAGLEPGDQILLVDGIDVRGLSPDALRELLAGNLGQTVRMTIVRGDEILRVQVGRTRPPDREEAAPRTPH